MSKLIILSCLLFFLIGTSCQDSTGSTPGPADVQKGDDDQGNERVFIVDQTGKRWDVTHAEEKYGMKAEDFQFGLGPFAIPPIQNPSFLQPGDNGFPSSQESFLVLGASLNGDTRAYPISVMSRHEIVDEKFDSTHVAVAY